MSEPAAAVDRQAGPARQTLHDVWSPQFQNRRDVDVYLPASYDAGGRHPVVYMHDGQNLSDPSIAFAGTWDLEAVLRDVAADGIEPIVVGVHNQAERMSEYSPFPDQRHGGGNGDAYVSFLIHTLKPRIDRRYRTRRDAAQTAIAGSSMGGLISLYAWLRRPDVFGRAAVMSPALWYGRAALFEFIERRVVPHGGRLYLDVGTAEGDATLEHARSLRSLIEGKLAAADAQLTYVEDPGAGHEEAAWGGRLRGALRFLLAERPAAAPSSDDAP